MLADQSIADFEQQSMELTQAYGRILHAANANDSVSSHSEGDRSTMEMTRTFGNILSVR